MRAYLAHKLGCDPMRITKKYTGALCLGKRVYHGTERNGITKEQIEAKRSELEELERKFRERLEQTGREKREFMSSVDFGEHFISTPAIDMIMQAPQWSVSTPSSMPFQQYMYTRSLQLPTYMRARQQSGDQDEHGIKDKDSSDEGGNGTCIGSRNTAKVPLTYTSSEDGFSSSTFSRHSTNFGNISGKDKNSTSTGDSSEDTSSNGDDERQMHTRKSVEENGLNSTEFSENLASMYSSSMCIPMTAAGLSFNELELAAAAAAYSCGETSAAYSYGERMSQFYPGYSANCSFNGSNAQSASSVTSSASSSSISSSSSSSSSSSTSSSCMYPSDTVHSSSSSTMAAHDKSIAHSISADDGSFTAHGTIPYLKNYYDINAAYVGALSSNYSFPSMFHIYTGAQTANDKSLNSGTTVNDESKKVESFHKSKKLATTKCAKRKLDTHVRISSESHSQSTGKRYCGVGGYSGVPERTNMVDLSSKSSDSISDNSREDESSEDSDETQTAALSLMCFSNQQVSKNDLLEFDQQRSSSK